MPLDPKKLPLLLRYEPETGKLFWLARGPEWFPNEKRDLKWVTSQWNNTFAGKEAFTSGAQGYKKGMILQHALTAHRVIWAMHNGSWPNGQIDHINGDRSDNRLENLRVVSNQGNSRNRKRRIDNVSGVTGVRWDKKGRKWGAQIMADNKRVSIGFYDDFAEAVAARKAAEAELNYHENHGRE
jgi:hypothetical protein